MFIAAGAPAGPFQHQLHRDVAYKLQFLCMERGGGAARRGCGAIHGTQVTARPPTHSAPSDFSR